MDIMNIMKVSSSKFTFSLIAFAALLVSGSALVLQDTYAAIDAPEFTAKHINTTATLITFDQDVNGTLAVLDWSIKTSSVAVAGGTATDYTISNVANATSQGIGKTTPSAKNKVDSSHTGVVGLGFINNSKYIVLIHSAIPSDAQYFVNYTNNPATLGDSGRQAGKIHANEEGGVGGGGVNGGVGNCFSESGGCKYLKIGSNATAADWMVPTATSAEVLKSNPKQIKILMSEAV